MRPKKILASPTLSLFTPYSPNLSPMSMDFKARAASTSQFLRVRVIVSPRVFVRLVTQPLEAVHMHDGSIAISFPKYAFNKRSLTSQPSPKSLPWH